MKDVELSPTASPRTREVVATLKKDNDELKEKQLALQEQNRKLQEALEELKTMVTKRKYTEDPPSKVDPPEPSEASLTLSSATGSKASHAKYLVDLEDSDAEISSEAKKAKGLEESWVEVPDVMEKPADTPKDD
jgi:hypothetical protein